MFETLKRSPADIAEWAGRNPKRATSLIAFVAGLLGMAAGWQLTVRNPQPGEQPGLILILPAFDEPAAARQVPPPVGDPLPLSPWGRLAVQAAILILERRAPRTPGDWDDRLLAVLRAIGAGRAAFERAERAAGGG